VGLAGYGRVLLLLLLEGSGGRGRGIARARARSIVMGFSQPTLNQRRGGLESTVIKIARREVTATGY